MEELKQDLAIHDPLFSQRLPCAQFQKISDMCQSLKALKLMSQQLQGISYMRRLPKDVLGMLHDFILLS